MNVKLCKMAQNVRISASIHKFSTECVVDMGRRIVAHDHTVFNSGIFKVIHRRGGYPPIV